MRIILDATVIRALLVPAVVSLFGRWNWWLPERPARLLLSGALAAPAGGRGGSALDDEMRDKGRYRSLIAHAAGPYNGVV